MLARIHRTPGYDGSLVRYVYVDADFAEECEVCQHCPDRGLVFIEASVRFYQGCFLEGNRMRRSLAGLGVGVLFFMLTLGTAFGQEVEDIDAWVKEWVAQADVGLSPGLIAEIQEVEDLHPWYFNNQDGSVTDPDFWRPLVAAYWPADTVDQALCLMVMESGGDPNADNPRSTARGLFQILASLWAPFFGVSSDDLYDPLVNVRLASEIYDIQGWDAWTPYLHGFCQEGP